ncbi:MAG: hypothetical protein E3J72_18980 [Planctomycetota bacterium]|nr:MAG: hypothetical protein E3J72_18980 [Planctomycetota bacterium]
MKKAVLVLIVSLICSGCAVGKRGPSAVFEDEGSMTKAAKRAEGEFNIAPPGIDVWIENAKGKLGAYHLEVHYNRAVVAVEKIIHVEGSRFAGPPIADAKTFSSGLTGIVGLQPGSGGLFGPVLVARVCFRPVAPGTSRVSVSIKSLYDPDSKPVTGTIKLSNDEVKVTPLLP